jgi:hypothetical protein
MQTYAEIASRVPFYTKYWHVSLTFGCETTSKKFLVKSQVEEYFAKITGQSILKFLDFSKEIHTFTGSVHSVEDILFWVIWYG